MDMMKKVMNITDDGLKVNSGLQFVGESKSQINDKLNKKMLEGFATVAAVAELSKKINIILEWSEMVRKAINEQDDVNKRHHRHINMVTNSINKINEEGVDTSSDKLTKIVEQLKKDTAVLKKYADINTNFVNKMADKQELIYEHANLTTKFVNGINEELSTIGTSVSTIQEHANISTDLVNSINEKVKKMSKKIYEEASQEQIDGILSEFDGKYDLVGQDIVLLDPTISDAVSAALTSAGVKNSKESDTKLILEEIDLESGEITIVAPATVDTEKIEGVLADFDGKADLVGSDIIFTDPTAVDAVASALSSAGVSTTKDGNKLIIGGAKSAPVVESKKPAKGKIDISKLNKKVENTIRLAKKKTADKIVDDTIDKYPFVSVLENGEIANFSKLNDVKKKIISEKVYESGAEDRGSVLNIVRSVNSDQGVVRLLSNMPNKVKPVWNKLTAKQRNQIVSLYNIKTFGNDMEVKAFWESLNIGGQSVQRMNENHAVDNVTIDSFDDDSSLGYDIDDVKATLKV